MYVAQSKLEEETILIILKDDFLYKIDSFIFSSVPPELFNWSSKRMSFHLELNLLIFYTSLQCDLCQVQSKRPTVAVATNRSHISFKVESSIISTDSSITDIIIRKIINQ